MKRILFDMQQRTERHMLSGNLYAVDRALERQGPNIYVDRTYTHHPTIASSRSFLMPNHNLWVMFWQGRSGPHPIQCYIHMARIQDGGNVVTVEDLYLDVIVRQNETWQLVDVDEYRESIARGELSPEQIQASLLGLENACRLVDGANGRIELHFRETLLRE